MLMTTGMNSVVLLTLSILVINNIVLHSYTKNIVSKYVLSAFSYANHDLKQKCTSIFTITNFKLWPVWVADNKQQMYETSRHGKRLATCSITVNTIKLNC